MKLRLNASLESLVFPTNTIFLIAVSKSPSSRTLTPPCDGRRPIMVSNKMPDPSAIPETAALIARR
jgi:hypothetical protein